MMATEVMVLYPMILTFVLTCMPHTADIQPMVASLTACCKMANLLAQAKRGHIPPQNRFIGSVEEWRRAFDAAYEDTVKPKAHFVFHVVFQSLRDQAVYDCFTGERKHQTVKAACKHITNTTIFEKSALTRTLGYQFSKLEQNPQLFDDVLIGQTQDWQGGKIGKMLQWQAVQLSSDDIVFLADIALFVCGCYSTADGFALVGRELFEIEKKTCFASRWRIGAEITIHQLCKGTSVDVAHAWMHEDKLHVFVIRC